MQVSAGKIVVLGTGGTIAGKAGSAGDNIGYVAGQVGVQELLEAVPGLMQAAQGPLQMEQVAQIDSKDMQFSVWSDLATRCLRYLADDTARAIVITHGTDTMAETAGVLGRALESGETDLSGKRIVLTGAMVPYSVSGSDALFNLGSAIMAAQLVEPGVYIAMNGRCFPWHSVRKNRTLGVFEGEPLQEE